MTPLELLTRALERMDAGALGETKSLSADDTPIERLWQMELYRALSTLLPDSVVVSPDFGRKYGVKGMVDFFVPAIGVALEVMRDGYDPDGHSKRFEPRGKYRLLLETGLSWQEIAQAGVQTCQAIYNLFLEDLQNSKNFSCNGEDVATVDVIGHADAATREAIGKLKGGRSALLIGWKLQVAAVGGFKLHKTA
eukprot:jgi/Chlat1/5149/Chrsp33S05142